ncbi:hypothetical protein L798_09708 [Zootermopsis nevadensis]|uniref:Ionotropic glutamate receptor L-glutamate and glycine-binding domain-containing protein n=1 Tax=Zootermopsis nevadensis TaxID=136037 RepID=A0A067R0T1_ZOONE|nr:hypothetical protein L798_09708 [Zootermopsis nevadensis]
MLFFVFLSISCWMLYTAVANMTDVQHLVACLIAISYKHFTPGSNIALSLPKRVQDNNNPHATLALNSTINNPEDSLPLELQRMAVWPITVFRHCDESPADSFDGKRQESHKSYIIVVYSEEEDDVTEDVAEQLQFLSYSASWNPRARFVVTAVIKAQLYDSQETAKNLLQEISLWKIFDVVVIVKASATHNTEKIKNDIQNFQINTWFPYQAPDRCSNVHEVTLLESWLMEGKGRLSKNTNLFPNKIKYDLNGCTITAATFPVDIAVGPYRYVDKNDSTATPSVTYESGTEVRLIKSVAEKLNLTLRFLPPPSKNEKWGDLAEDGTFTGLLGDVVYGRADVGFAVWPLHPKLLVIMDATKSYLGDDWVWWVPCAKKVPRWKSISMVFLPSTWSALLVSVIFAVVIIPCMVTREPSELKIYRNCGNSVSTVWATFLGVSIPRMPKTVPVRTFLISWIWYCLAINTIFQTFLISFLIEPGLQHQMNSLQEILASEKKYGYNEWFDMVVRDTEDEFSETILRNRVACNEGNEPPCLDWVAHHDNFSLLCSRALLQYILTREYLDKNGKPLICQAGGLFFPVNYVTYMAKWNPLLNRFNDIITRLLESGISDKWIESGLYLQRVHARTSSRRVGVGEYYDISLEHSQGIFAILLPGTILSVMVFFLEVFYHMFSLK